MQGCTNPGSVPLLISHIQCRIAFELLEENLNKQTKRNWKGGVCPRKSLSAFPFLTTFPHTRYLAFPKAELVMAKA